jgi:hypothetical protein
VADDFLRDHPASVEITGARFGSSQVAADHELPTSLADAAFAEGRRGNEGVAEPNRGDLRDEGGPGRRRDDAVREEGEEDQSDEETDTEGGSDQEETQGGRRGKNPKEGEGFDDGFQQVTQKKHGDRKNHI